jgi:hypothetical protein
MVISHRFSLVNRDLLGPYVDVEDDLKPTHQQGYWMLKEVVHNLQRSKKRSVIDQTGLETDKANVEPVLS